VKLLKQGPFGPRILDEQIAHGENFRRLHKTHYR